MTISVADAFLTSVQNTLLDTTGVAWPVPELLGYYNIFVTIAIGEKPDALTRAVQFELAEGVEQRLDSSGVMFLKAPANVASGRGITQVTPEAMLDADPDWYAAPKTTDVEHIIVNDNDPLRFRCYPPNNGEGQIWVDEAYAPDDVTDASQPFQLTEAYRGPARNAVLAMAYAKGTDRGDIAKSEFYFKLLDGSISATGQAQMQAKARTGTPQTTE